MNTKLLPCLLAASLAAVALPAAAQSAGDWTIGIGVHQVDPKSDNGVLANGTLPLSINSDAKPSLTFEYFIRENLGVEVLAAWPFQHDISVKGVGRVGSTKHLPPTVSLQYHFGQGKVKPFVGLGVNYTRFFSTKTEGPIAGAELELSDSWGLAGHVGIDFQVGAKGAIRVDYRRIDIDTKAKLNGANLGTRNTVNIDPSVYGIAYVFAF